jgi:hypothetical protein
VSDLPTGLPQVKVSVIESSFNLQPGGDPHTPILHTVVKILGPPHAIDWITKQITESGTSAVMHDDPDWSIIYVVPRVVTGDTYRRWIESWIETHWTETLAEYLKLAYAAVTESAA